MDGTRAGVWAVRWAITIVFALGHVAAATDHFHDLGSTTKTGIHSLIEEVVTMTGATIGGLIVLVTATVLTIMILVMGMNTEDNGEEMNRQSETSPSNEEDEAPTMDIV